LRDEAGLRGLTVVDCGTIIATHLTEVVRDNIADMLSYLEVQKLLIDRAAVDADLNTWEPWGEIVAALGRLPYDTAEQVAAAEAVLVVGLPSPDSMNAVNSPPRIGSAGGRWGGPVRAVSWRWSSFGSRNSVAWWCKRISRPMALNCNWRWVPGRSTHCKSIWPI